MKGILKKVALVMLAVVVVGVLYFRFGARPEPLPEGSESVQLLESGEHRVATWELTLVDSSRTSQAYAEFAGTPFRTLETTVWYPGDLVPPQGGAAARPLPLLVYSHGFMSNRAGGTYLAEHLASHGYIVAAMDHPLTHGGAPAGPLIDDVANQPGDVRFLVDRFLAWHLDEDHRFEGAVDQDRIGSFGLSLGGLTATLATFHPRFGDPRIDAAISIAGPTFMLSPGFFEHRDRPFMMIGGDIDAIVSYEANAAPILDKVPGALLVTIEDASHVGFADMARSLRFVDNPDAMGCTAITANVEEEDAWWTDLGSPEEGVLVQPPESPLCEIEPLPASMNPLRQQWLTLLAVTAFFESHFSEEPAERQRFHTYLTETFPSELEAVTVEEGGPASAPAADTVQSATPTSSSPGA